MFLLGNLPLISIEYLRFATVSEFQYFFIYLAPKSSVKRPNCPQTEPYERSGPARPLPAPICSQAHGLLWLKAAVPLPIYKSTTLTVHILLTQLWHNQPTSYLLHLN